ncbi:hypothetical protein T492DRAFT_932677 [Pavlovales sp. CCMP2436]|nr:hypothetical protein T492DRAFT_932677 [Pavlovales sp. CCMP2436]
MEPKAATPDVLVLRALGVSRRADGRLLVRPLRALDLESAELLSAVIADAGLEVGPVVEANLGEFDLLRLAIEQQPKTRSFPGRCFRCRGRGHREAQCPLLGLPLARTPEVESLLREHGWWAALEGATQGSARAAQPPRASGGTRLTARERSAASAPRLHAHARPFVFGAPTFARTLFARGGAEEEVPELEEYDGRDDAHSSSGYIYTHTHTHTYNNKHK